MRSTAATSTDDRPSGQAQAVEGTADRWRAAERALAGVAIVGVLVAATITIYLGVRAPSALGEQALHGLRAEQELLARVGAQRVGEGLATIQRHLRDERLLAAVGLRPVRMDSRLAGRLGALKEGFLSELGVVLLLFDATGHVFAVDDTVPPAVAEHMRAHIHEPGAGEVWPAHDATGVCPKCRAHMEAASVAVSLGHGLLLGANIDVETLARRMLRDLHTESGMSAWLSDSAGHPIAVSGSIEATGARDELVSVLTAPVPGSRGWQVSVAADHQFATGHVVREGRVLVTLSAAIAGLLLAALAALAALQRRRVRRRTEQLLRASHRDKLASLGLVAANVGHELRNHLAVAQGNVELARMVVEDPEIASALGDARRALADIGRLGDDMRRYGRASRTRRRAPVALDQPVAAALRLVRPMMRSHGLAVAVEAVGQTPVVEADEGQLTQVVVNLLNNACDAMEGFPHTGRAIAIRITNGGSSARVAVSDQGPGLSEEVQERLFTPFFTTKAVDKGTGLGLPLCARIIAEHGGRISAENVPRSGDRPGGARFTIELPLLPATG